MRGFFVVIGYFVAVRYKGDIPGNRSYHGFVETELYSVSRKDKTMAYVDGE